MNDRPIDGHERLVPVRPTAWWDAPDPPRPRWRRTVEGLTADAGDALVAAGTAALWIVVLAFAGTVGYGALRYWADVLEGWWGG